MNDLMVGQERMGMCPFARRNGRDENPGVERHFRGGFNGDLSSQHAEVPSM